MERHQRSLSVNGVQLQLTEVNPQGQRLALLLHGFPETAQMWQPLLPTLVQLGYRVWMPDQRGYNRSDKPHDIAAYNLDVLMQDVLGLIMAAGLQEVLLLGHDWGGAVAWWVANKHPELLRHLIILNAPHHQVFARYMRQHWRQRFKSWYMFFFQLPYLPELVLRLGRGWLLAEALRRSSLPGSFSKPELEQYRKAWMQPGALSGMLNWYRASFRHRPNRPPDWQIRVPTLLIWGKGDHALDWHMAQESIALCEAGTVALIEEATHWVLADQPGQVSALIRDFLAES